MNKQNEEGPILFKGAMVRAIVNGQKIMTRRVRGLGDVNKDPCNYQLVADSSNGDLFVFSDPEGFGKSLRCPYGFVGKQLWVRETWRVNALSDEDSFISVRYKADDSFSVDNFVPEYEKYSDQCLEDCKKKNRFEWNSKEDCPYRWRPSIHMPRWASRITLRVNAVRVERLQDITEADAIAEGIVGEDSVYAIYLDGGVAFRCATAREVFAQLWEHINGAGSWDANPWVWVVGFDVESIRK